MALITTARVGFLVDAAVLGFAVGTGFALFENLTYLRSLTDATVVVWVVRGLGTAMLQGATTAIFAMLSKTHADQLRDRSASHLALAFLPGLGRCGRRFIRSSTTGSFRRLPRL